MIAKIKILLERSEGEVKEVSQKVIKNSKNMPKRKEKLRILEEKPRRFNIYLTEVPESENRKKK